VRCIGENSDLIIFSFRWSSSCFIKETSQLRLLIIEAGVTKWRCNGGNLV